MLLNQTWSAQGLDGELVVGINNQGETAESLAVGNPVPYRDGLAQLYDQLAGRVIVTVDAPTGCAQLG